MKHWIAGLLALVLVFALAGCGIDLDRYSQALENVYLDSGFVAYEDMHYARPDMEQLEQCLETVLEAAAGSDFPKIISAIDAMYASYDDFYTNYSLADIRNCADLTDAYWMAECEFFAENSGWMDAAMEQMYYALAKSPCKDQLEGKQYFGTGFFDAYQGESNWDEAFITLLAQESELVGQYYELSSVGLDYEDTSQAYYDACGEEMAQLLIQLVKKRREIAAYWGYGDYNQFAMDFYYYRDFTIDQARAYLEEIQVELVDLYCQLDGSSIWDSGYRSSNEGRTLDYVRRVAENMGGTVAQAFTLLDRAGLYDIGYGAEKYPASFEVYLSSYAEPFIFMNPSLTVYDHLTLAHEFGHFCNDFASYGSGVGIDVAEFFSQGMEYLSLCYTDAPGELEKLKMADSLCTFVEQAALASFEMELYGLPEEQLTVENVHALYDRIAREYGFESVGYEPWEYVTVTHFYTNPLYIISYVVSNDAAMQLYQLEKQESGAGLARYEENLDTLEYYFLSFLESAGLESPFAPGRIQQVRRTFEEVLK